MTLSDGSTDSQRWDRVQELLGDALELSPDDRVAYLDRNCRDDSALREEVESLIGASEASDAYFGDLADRAGMTLSTETRETSEQWREAGGGGSGVDDPAR